MAPSVLSQRDPTRGVRRDASMTLGQVFGSETMNNTDINNNNIINNNNNVDHGEIGTTADESVASRRSQRNRERSSRRQTSRNSPKQNGALHKSLVLDNNSSTNHNNNSNSVLNMMNSDNRNHNSGDLMEDQSIVSTSSSRRSVRSGRHRLTSSNSITQRRSVQSNHDSLMGFAHALGGGAGTKDEDEEEDEDLLLAQSDPSHSNAKALSKRSGKSGDRGVAPPRTRSNRLSDKVRSGNRRASGMRGSGGGDDNTVETATSRASLMSSSNKAPPSTRRNINHPALNRGRDRDLLNSSRNTSNRGIHRTTSAEENIPTTGDRRSRRVSVRSRSRTSRPKIQPNTPPPPPPAPPSGGDDEVNITGISANTDNIDILDINTLDAGHSGRSKTRRSSQQTIEDNDAAAEEDNNNSSSRHYQDGSERSKKAGVSNVITDTSNNTSRKSRSGSGRSISLTDFNNKINISNDDGKSTDEQQEQLDKDGTQESANTGNNSKRRPKRPSSDRLKLVSAIKDGSNVNGSGRRRRATAASDENNMDDDVTNEAAGNKQMKDGSHLSGSGRRRRGAAAGDADDDNGDGGKVMKDNSHLSGSGRRRKPRTIRDGTAPTTNLRRARSGDAISSSKQPRRNRNISSSSTYSNLSARAPKKNGIFPSETSRSQRKEAAAAAAASGADRKMRQSQRKLTATAAAEAANARNPSTAVKRASGSNSNHRPARPSRTTSAESALGETKGAAEKRRQRNSITRRNSKQDGIKPRRRSRDSASQNDYDDDDDYIDDGQMKDDSRKSQKSQASFEATYLVSGLRGVSGSEASYTDNDDDETPAETHDTAKKRGSGAWAQTYLVSGVSGDEKSYDEADNEDYLVVAKQSMDSEVDEESDLSSIESSLDDDSEDDDESIGDFAEFDANAFEDGMGGDVLQFDPTQMGNVQRVKQISSEKKDYDINGHTGHISEIVDPVSTLQDFSKKAPLFTLFDNPGDVDADETESMREHGDEDPLSPVSHRRKSLFRRMGRKKQDDDDMDDDQRNFINPSSLGYEDPSDAKEKKSIAQKASGYFHKILSASTTEFTEVFDDDEASATSGKSHSTKERKSFKTLFSKKNKNEKGPLLRLSNQSGSSKRMSDHSGSNNASSELDNSALFGG